MVINLRVVTSLVQFLKIGSTLRTSSFELALNGFEDHRCKDRENRTPSRKAAMESGSALNSLVNPVRQL